MKTYQDLLREAKREVPEVSASEVKTRLERGEKFVLLDVRDNDEYKAGYIPSAEYLSRGRLEMNIDDVVPDRDTSIITYCAGGVRSLLAAQVLKQLGYKNVASMAGGYNNWTQSGYPTAKPRVFTPEQTERYSRHFALPQVGVEGQAKLLDAKVLLIGAGGLGSPSGLYLASNGVGTIGIVDNDVVDLSNLQRQVIHNMNFVGKPKVLSAKETINALNPDVKVIPYETKLTAENAMEIIQDYDVILDGTDHFNARYLVNDACYLAKKPLVHGSIFQFEGYVTVFYPDQGPCYRCFVPSPPPDGLVPS